MITPESYKGVVLPEPKNVIKVAVPIAPKSIQSVRFSARGGYVQAFQPAANKRWKLAIKTAVSQQLPAGWKPFKDVPLYVSTTYVFPPLKSLRKAERLQIESGGVIFKQTKPDVNDNLNKGLYDALTGVLWDDDARVAYSSALKIFGKETGIIIMVGELPEGVVERMLYDEEEK